MSDSPAGARTAGTSAPSRPNILLLIADQFAAHALSCAGSEHLSTPNLDRLAERGIRFERAYTTFPLCVPARASMLTGRMPHELGVNGNRQRAVGSAAAPEPGERPDSLGRLLASAGYDCVFAGKFHATRASARAEDGFTVLSPFGDRGLAETASRWLTERADTARPFFLTVSFDDPHTICEYARGQALPYGEVPAAETRDAPPVPPNFWPAPDEAEAPRHEKGVQNAVYATEAYTVDEWRAYRYAYARLVERADAMIGEVLAAVEEAGLTEDTLVLFTSDHGDGDASHLWNQKTALFEECVRVPLIAAGPGIGQGADDRLVSVGLDLLPTLCAVAHAETPGDLAGQDVLLPPAAEAHVRDIRQIVVETAFDHGDPPITRGRALILGRYKYVVYNWGRRREQLHDLLADPGETRNLATESRFDRILDDMRARMMAWCLAHDDGAFLKALRLPSTAGPDVHERIFEKPY